MVGQSLMVWPSAKSFLALQVNQNLLTEKQFNTSSTDYKVLSDYSGSYPRSAVEEYRLEQAYLKNNI